MWFGLILLIATVVSSDAIKALPFQKYHEQVGIPAFARIKQHELSRDGRIGGGSIVTAGAQPHMAGIIVSLTDGFTSTCSASLLTNTRSLTAAHCWHDGWQQAYSFELVFGSSFLLHGGTRLSTSQVVTHEDWDSDSLHNDLAMITHAWVEYNDVINHILLPSGSELDMSFTGMSAVAAGFGLIQTGPPAANPDKRQASLQVITNEACRSVFGSTYVIDSTLCTSGSTGANICSGDTGGPLAVEFGNSRVLIGVASFSSMECNVGLPGVFTRVTHYLPWIVPRLLS